MGGAVYFTDGTSQPIVGFGLEDIGAPPGGGANFNLTLEDLDWSASNQTQILRWSISFLPRPGVSQPSPIANAFTTGGAVTTSNGLFVLIDKTGNGANILKNSGNSQKDWDWFLMAQVQMPDQSIKVFVSDPEMQMDTEG
jgi:hypothetical protein